MNYHDPQPNEQREEHTLRTIEAIGILKGAFEEIERLELKINGLELELQEARNAAFMARSIKSGVYTPASN